MQRFLSHLLVLELGGSISAAYCSRLMGSLGAEVIKIEPPEGDETRRLGPFPGDIPHVDRSAQFMFLNMGKKGITLDLDAVEGVELFRKLAAQASLIIEGFPPGQMEQRGMGYMPLAASNPALVMTSVTPFGQDGPYASYLADDLIVQAIGGWMNLLGYPDQYPLKYGGNAALYLTGLAAFATSVAALFQASVTGHGDMVDVSAMEAVVCSHIQDLVNFSYTGTVEGRMEPTFVFPCADGVVVFTVQQYLWPRICQMVGMPELEHDPLFATREARVDNYDVLHALVVPWTLDRTKEEIYHHGQRAGVPSGFVASMRDIATSPQYQERGFFEELDYPGIGPVLHPGVPFKLGKLPTSLGRAPLLGEHNDDILVQRLGLDGVGLEGLRRRGVV